MDPKSRNFRYFKGNKHKQINNKQTTNKKSNKTKVRSRSLKKQIHDTQRLLFKNILCEDGIKAQQEKLAKLKESFYETKRLITHNKKLTKYKGIKFFDKSKIMKKLTSLTKLLSTADSGEKEDKNILEEFNLYKRYLNYVTYFPTDRKYISLFPTSDRLDPGAQVQLDAVIQETDSKVKQGLYADAWVAHEAKTITSPVHVTEDMTSPEIEESTFFNSTSSPRTAAPLFIPIDKPVGKKATATGPIKKQSSKKLDHRKSTDTPPVDSPIKLPPTYDNDVCEVECGDDLKSDSFFFFDTKGSKVDTHLFKNRPQKRNFQDTHNPKQIPRNSRPNSRNTKHKDKYRGQS